MGKLFGKSLVNDAEIKRREPDFMHARLVADIYEYFVNEESDVRVFFRKFAGRLRELINCDQLIYRDKGGVAMIDNSPEIEKIWGIATNAPISISIRRSMSKALSK